MRDRCKYLIPVRHRQSRGSAVHFGAAVIVALFASMAPNSVRAASQTWDNGSGSFIWNNKGTDKNWVSNKAWVNGNDATFGSTGAGTVKVDSTGVGGTTANSITINATGYTFTPNAAGNVLTLVGSGIITATQNTTFSVPIGGTVGLTSNGSAILTLSGANTYTGGTNVQNGTLVLGSGGSLSTSNVMTLGNGTTSGVFQLGNGGGGVNTTVTSLTVSGTGTANAVVGGSASTSTLTINNSVADNYSGRLGGAGANQNNLALTKTGNGTLTLSGANTYTGGTNINGGTLNVGSSGALGTPGTISFGGGTLQYSASNATDYSSRFSNAANQAYSIDTNGQSVTFASNLTSSGGTLAKLGSGTLTLSGTNTYTGATTVNGGRLLVNGSTSSSSTVAVNNSGTVLGGTGIIGGAVNVNAGAVINAGPQGANGTSASVGTLTTGALTLAGTATFHTDAFGTATTEWDKVVVNGSASLGSSTLDVIIASGLSFNPGDTYTLIDANAISGTFNGIADNSLQSFSGYEFIAHYNLGGDGNFELVAVPEPSTWFAAALALCAIGYSQRKRFRLARACAPVSK